ncbi:redox-sensitive transcriptional activator SoxR [Octadecabacter sp. G9-8]|uniref:Redox-sensitive transcriptional activator SoxR n=1 Tax=Octadecabacter dasysiphoniae TaxID=2909341 RepID=A0ABS9D1A3_9RHOB|nr:redox-sensitive transcriptional activator SoxR [Octadecabacter dasysiphoniae]MCF2872844.1 redox-sensitive transcriptional activator SoxR [Octadecabacter dasysiphoniae]
MSGLTIGDLSTRTGLAVSAIRFYETHGIVHPVRNAGGHRRYDKADLRRLSFAMIAQRLGFSLADIAAHMAHLPTHKAPSKTDWSKISKTMRIDITERITQLEKLRDRLDGCIGCGCLSLASCALYNPSDTLGALGAGPRTLLTD